MAQWLRALAAGFNSQCPYGGSQLSVTPFPWDPKIEKGKRKEKSQGTIQTEEQAQPHLRGEVKISLEKVADRNWRSQESLLAPPCVITRSDAELWHMIRLSSDFRGTPARTARGQTGVVSSL